MLQEVRSYFAECGEKLNTSSDEFERRMTKSQYERITKKALLKYGSSRIEPGEAVGATGAQSISEVSERSERALTRTRVLAMNPAKWLQT